MKNLLGMSALGLLVLFQACGIQPKNKEKASLTAIFPKGEKTSSEQFTGNAFHHPLLGPNATNKTLVGNVYFEAGARCNWHTHPHGQILVITDGVAWHQMEGQAIEVLKKGDVAYCPPNVKHWHGASAEQGAQQMYIVPDIENGVVNWMEPVSDEVYKGKHKQ